MIDLIARFARWKEHVMELHAAVHFILLLIAFIAIFALLYGLNSYLARKFPGYAPMAWIPEVAIVVIAFLVAIGFVLHLVGVPLIKFT
jgi:heme A synthase